MNSNVKKIFVLAVAALLAIGMILPYAMAAAAAASPVTTRDPAPLGQVPGAVRASVEPGGEVAEHVTELLRSTPSPSASGRLKNVDPDAVTFGPPLRYAVVSGERWGSGATLGEDDIADGEETYLALLLNRDNPVDVVQISATGSFIALGGLDGQSLTQLATVEPGTVVLSEPARHAYLLASPDLDAVRPLNRETVDLMGSEALSVAEYRALARPTASASAPGSAASPTAQIESVVPGSPAAKSSQPAGSSSPWLPAILVGIGIAAVGALAVAVARSSRHIDL